MKDTNCFPSRCDASCGAESAVPPECLRQWVAEAGGAACGVADALAVADDDFARFDKWLARGMHGGMRYMENYRELRRDPQLLLPGAKSVVVAAFSYYHSDQTEGNLASIAAYAHGDDYHEVVRERLGRVAARIKEAYGGETRVCVDTAPMLERYWAVRAGIGFVGRNRLLIVPGAGSYVFIGSVLTTVRFMPDAPNEGTCDGCGRCIAACPGKALSEEGVDARRCLSYLTIEHRGEFPDGTNLHGHLYGCDTCQRVCPHNRSLPDTPIAEFHAREALRTLTPEKIIRMGQSEFSAIMRRSAIKRTKLAGLQRNALRLLRDDDHIKQ